MEAKKKDPIWHLVVGWVIAIIAFITSVSNDKRRAERHRLEDRAKYLAPQVSSFTQMVNEGGYGLLVGKLRQTKRDQDLDSLESLRIELLQLGYLLRSYNSPVADRAWKSAREADETMLSLVRMK